MFYDANYFLLLYLVTRKIRVGNDNVNGPERHVQMCRLGHKYVFFYLFHVLCIQYFTLPHILRWTLVDSTSKLPNTSFWTTLDAGVWWNPLDSTRLQHPNHCRGLELGLGLGFRLVLGLGLGVMQVYILWPAELAAFPC